MVTKTDLEDLARGFDTSTDFDAVMAYYDVLEVANNLVGTNLLEMGTSAGTITRYLLSYAKRLDIVEGSKTGIERTKKLLGDGKGKIHYFHECWENFRPRQQYSDIVFIRGLEHVEDPVSLLRNMKQWMTKNGRIHIIVPNAQSLHRRVMIAEGTLPDAYALRDRDHQVGHLRIYDKESLERNIRYAGLSVVYSQGFFLKPVGTSQMGEISMDPQHPLVRACYTAGKLFPELGTQLYVIAERKCNH